MIFVSSDHNDSHLFSHHFCGSKSVGQCGYGQEFMISHKVYASISVAVWLTSQGLSCCDKTPGLKETYGETALFQGAVSYHVLQAILEGRWGRDLLAECGICVTAEASRVTIFRRQEGSSFNPTKQPAFIQIWESGS